MPTPRATLLLLLAAAAGLTAQAADAPRGEKYALLVGVQQYSEAKELRALAYPERDVTDLAQTLRDNGYKTENVVLMTQTVGAAQLRFLPVKKRIQKELALLLAGSREGDTVLLGFAGHGVKFNDDPASYFCPADAQLDDKDSLLSLTDVYRQLEKGKAGLKVLLVDACRNDPLTGGSRAPTKMDLQSVTRPPEPTAQGGVVAFFSCSEKEKAFEADKLNHGVFFHYVIEGLKGEANGDKDDVTALELGAYVSRHVHDFVRTEYGTDQTPELTGSSRGTAPLAQTPGDVRAFRRGSACLEKQDYDGALAAFTKAVEINPKSAVAFRERGEAYTGKQVFDKAVADQTEALRLDPKLPGASFKRGWAYAQLNERDKAIADYTDAIRLDGNDYWAFNNRGAEFQDKGELDKAVADFSETIRIDPKSEDAYYNRARAYNTKGENDKSIADANTLLGLNPKSGPGYFIRGCAYSSLNDSDKAIADYTEAIKIDPKDIGSRINRGIGYGNRKDYDKAITDYNQALKIDPKNAYVYFLRGCAHNNKQEWDKGIADCSESIRLDPNNALAYGERSFSYLNAEVKQNDKVIADCTEAIRLDPNYALAYENRGAAYDNLGNTARGDADRRMAKKIKEMK